MRAATQGLASAAGKQRLDDWAEVAAPSLDDWLRLLDGVRRRAGRHLASAADQTRLVAEIRRRFPGADVG